MKEIETDLLIVGGGTGGVAAALGASLNGVKVVMTERYDWVGGQMTSQAVPADEHPWVERSGVTGRYRAWRDGVRAYYKRHMPLNEGSMANSQLNPGLGWVSRICCLPGIAHASLMEMMRWPMATGNLVLLGNTVAVSAELKADKSYVDSVKVKSLRDGEETVIHAKYVVDGTDLGELLPMTGTEYVTGAESQRQTGEMHAVTGDAEPENVQGFTWCMPVAYDDRKGANHVIDKPEGYEFWRDFVPQLDPPYVGKLFSWVDADPVKLQKRQMTLFADSEFKKKSKAVPLWTYRRIQTKGIYTKEAAREVDEISLVNWIENDYFIGNIIDKDEKVVAERLKAAKQLSKSLLYWMQTEAPNHSTGGVGYPGLYLVPTLAGTVDGLAQAPYIRESRRIKAEYTLTEGDIGRRMRFEEEHPGRAYEDGPFRPGEGLHARQFEDSVGVGYYRIDLHPSTNGRNYVDISSLPFQIPLGSLIPVRMENLLPACKNLGTTHITNGCVRVHPSEWNIGESVGMLVAYCLKHGKKPREVLKNKAVLRDYQKMLTEQGVQLKWAWEKK